MSDHEADAIKAALQARDESQSMTDEGLTRDMLAAAAAHLSAAERRSDRCPATIRHVPSYASFAIGVQCKYERGHDGDHAGHASFSEGDVFWPQEGRGTFVRKETGQ